MVITSNGPKFASIVTCVEPFLSVCWQQWMNSHLYHFPKPSVVYPCVPILFSTPTIKRSSTIFRWRLLACFRIASAAFCGPSPGTDVGLQDQYIIPDVQAPQPQNHNFTPIVTPLVIVTQCIMGCFSRSWRIFITLPLILCLRQK